MIYERNEKIIWIIMLIIQKSIVPLITFLKVKLMQKVIEYFSKFSIFMKITLPF